jgi:hypothetical protein
MEIDNYSNEIRMTNIFKKQRVLPGKNINIMQA